MNRFPALQTTSSPTPAHPSLAAWLIMGALLFGSAAVIALPTAASASSRDGHREVVTVTTLSPHSQRAGWVRGHRYGGYHHSRRRIERARRYASQATAQASLAWRRGCGRSGPRWSTSWDDHYFWALDARPRELRRELDRREDHLHGCRAHHRHGARHYRHAWPY